MIRIITYRTVTLLLLTIICFVSAEAQVPEQLYFENFTVEEGLPGNPIRDITQDSLGFMWFAAEGGVARYDGYEFEVFRNIPGDQTSISDDDVTRIITDKYGDIWVNTFVGIEKYDPLTNTFIRHFQNPSDSTYIEPGSVSMFVSTRVGGDLWIGAIEHGLIRYNPKTGDFKKYKSIVNDDDTLNISVVFDLTEDPDGNIWISTESSGILKFELETETITRLNFEESDPAGLKDKTTAKRVFVDSDNRLWIDYAPVLTWSYDNIQTGDDTGLWVLDLKTGNGKPFAYDPIKQPFTGPLFYPLESDSVIWFARPFPLSGKIGLHAWSRTDSSYTLFKSKANDPNSLITDHAEVIYIDTFGSLWVGTQMGLSKTDISRKRLEAFSADPDQIKSDANRFAGIIEVRPNIFWITRTNQDPIEWDRNANTWKEFKLPYSSSSENEFDAFGSLIGVKQGDNIWYRKPDLKAVGNYNVITGEDNTYDIFREGSDDYVVLGIHTNDDRNVWVSSRVGLTGINTETGASNFYPLLSGFITNDTLAIQDIAFATGDTIWTMTIDVPLDSSRQTFGILLNRFNPASGTYEPIEIDQNYLDALGHGYAVDLLADHNGDLWISKSNGLVHYDVSEDHFTWYNQEDGLADRFVLKAVEDELGMIWMSTQYGISRFDPENKSFRNFERSDGLRSIQLTPEGVIKRENGEILFTGVGGLNIVDPATLEEYGIPPSVLLTGLTIDGNRYATDKPLSQTDLIELPWGQSGLEIGYTAINFRSADKTTYSYQMEGINDEFIDVGTRRYAQFTKLEPGDYTFRVRATNADGLSSENDTILAITILPPWWRTWWAYLIYTLIFAAGIFLVDRVQRRRVLYKEKERAREKELKQAKKIEEAYRELERSHENLKAAQEQLVQQEKLASLGQLTAGIAHEIKNPLNFVNNFSDLSIELIDEVRQELASVWEIKESPQQQDINAILSDIETNLKKIHEHGSRADSIVKSMLQHSRGGSGEKKDTDINELVNEYVNLAYHGMRAGKDPINVDIIFEPDEKAGMVPVIAEDFSRVIVNLCNNAFDALREKLALNSTKGLEVKNNKGEKFSPELFVSTRLIDNTIEVQIRDNGPGIADEIREKIMQPFYTTKKGKEGTGLGLSISNDVMQAHGGKIEIESKVGQFTLFRLYLTKNG
ncbi:ATP-binding protein [Balneola sp. MJW-20]|uniref:sensor histidine kinase n=1 Tax=Gracilimonas aurantiaca TaxID=3234185 RepID=UPI003466460E